MRKVAVIGAGKIGSTVVELLTGYADYEVLVIDAAAGALAGLAGRPRVEPAAMASTSRAPSPAG
jgi:saccharopine dehydrogenase-like NADP-dependent oxidoreductase